MVICMSFIAISRMQILYHIFTRCPIKCYRQRQNVNCRIVWIKKTITKYFICYKQVVLKCKFMSGCSCVKLNLSVFMGLFVLLRLFFFFYLILSFLHIRFIIMVLQSTLIILSIFLFQALCKFFLLILIKLLHWRDAYVLLKFIVYSLL